MGSAAPDLCLKNITMKFGDLTVLDDISLEVSKGEFLSLLGPSGCGKTTALRIIAGFLTPERGEIYIQGRLINRVPTSKRGIGMVFQNYAIFPHMNVFENVAFGLRMKKTKEQEIKGRVGEVLALLRLEGFEERFPYQLSGGQQQRVALARALVIDPYVLLLDEPLGALDKKLREEMQVELRQLQKKIGITTIFVTHDQEEALTLSDKIAVMQKGRIEQVGPPLDIYERPQSKFVSGFIGICNFLSGEVTDVDSEGLTCRLKGGSVVRLPYSNNAQRGTEVELAIRPEKLMLSREEPPGQRNYVKGVLTNVVYLGTTMYYHTRIQSGDCMIVHRQITGASDEAHFSIGEEVYLSWPPGCTLVISR